MPSADRPLRALVVEDERLARSDLVTLLRNEPAVFVVGEAETVAQAAAIIQAQDPDVIFLDVRLGGESGLEVLDHCGEQEVVFVTAYDEYAVRAFEIEALDYLLKPVSADRLSSTIARLLDRRDSSALPVAPDSLEMDDRLFLRLDGAWSFVRVGDIRAIHAHGKETWIDLRPGVRRRSTKALAEWVARLPSRQFVRIHRSTVVQLAHVERVEEWSHYSYLVYLRGAEQPVVMSRRHAARLKELLA